MILKVANPELTYKLMIGDKSEDYGEGWKKEDKDRLQGALGYQYNAVELPWPFDMANLTISRINESFWASIMITARNSSVFKGTSEAIVRALGNQSLEGRRRLVFYPTSINSTGHVAYEKSREARMSIMDTESGKSRVISIGKTGAYERKFGSLERFREDITELEKITNLLAKVWLEPFVARGELTLPEDFYLYLTP